jgi:hypothetical protein
MSAQRIAAIAFVLVVGFTIGHFTRSPRRIAPVPHWPAEPPTQIIVSRQDGDVRRNHLLRVSRVSDSNGRHVHDTGDPCPRPWRVVLSTPGGSYLAECQHMGDDTLR